MNNSNEAIIIRPMIENDILELAELYTQFWNEDSSVKNMQINFKKINSNKNYILLSALNNNKLVGSILGIICDELYGNGNPFLLIEDLIIDKNYRRKSIGKALMNQMENLAKKAQCSQIILVTENERKETIQFYESLGYNPHTHCGFKKVL